MLRRGRRGALPNLLVIGANRCGTTSLHEYLSAHPQVAMSRTKELRYFADRPDLGSGPPPVDPIERDLVGSWRGTWQRGVEWYRSQFDPSAPIRGESSPIYTNPWFGYCAERVAEVVPDAKLIFCVRDPVERAISQYRHAQAMGRDPRPADAALLANSLYAQESRYTGRLQPYLARFPEERIYVLEREDLESRRGETLEGVWRFLGVDADFWSSDFERLWNVSARQSGTSWGAINRLRRLPGWERVASLPPRRSLWLVERMAGSRRVGSRPAPTPAVRERLGAAVADDAARFRALTGRPFRSWSV